LTELADKTRVDRLFRLCVLGFEILFLDLLNQGGRSVWRRRKIETALDHRLVGLFEHIAIVGAKVFLPIFIANPARQSAGKSY
jgi:hypothetical protein